MRKITAIVYETMIPEFRAVDVTGWESIAWGNQMIVTKQVLGHWQVYDTDSRMLVVRYADSRQDALAQLEQAEADITTETYKQAVRYWKNRQGRLEESEQSISFRLNTARNGAI